LRREGRRGDGVEGKGGKVFGRTCPFSVLGVGGLSLERRGNARGGRKSFISFLIQRVERGRVEGSSEDELQGDVRSLGIGVGGIR